MPHRDALIAANARIEALEARLDELQPKDETEADRLTALQEEVERLRDELDDREDEAESLGSELSMLEAQLESFGMSRELVEQVAASEAAAAREEATRKRAAPWFRQRPRTFGALVVVAWIAFAAVACVLGAWGLGSKAFVVLGAMHGIAILVALWPVYTGASRWADPSLRIYTTEYAYGTDSSGDQVSVATGVKSSKATPGRAITLAAFGLVLWAGLAAVGTYVIRTADVAELREDEAPTPAPPPAGASKAPAG